MLGKRRLLKLAEKIICDWCEKEITDPQKQYTIQPPSSIDEPMHICLDCINKTQKFILKNGKD